mmetsp:Transcript_59604/g.129372  ORF Transcript_59604/g.129372 Transcript_59604/m.129372 type:complete len:260 (+) Transcript_59604:915-1694(+)
MFFQEHTEEFVQLHKRVFVEDFFVLGFRGVHLEQRVGFETLAERPQGLGEVGAHGLDVDQLPECGLQLGLAHFGPVEVLLEVLRGVQVEEVGGRVYGEALHGLVDDFADQLVSAHQSLGGETVVAFEHLHEFFGSPIAIQKQFQNWVFVESVVGCKFAEPSSELRLALVDGVVFVLVQTFVGQRINNNPRLLVVELLQQFLEVCLPVLRVLPDCVAAYFPHTLDFVLGLAEKLALGGLFGVCDFDREYFLRLTAFARRV